MRDESKFGKGRRLCALALCAALCLGCGTVRDVDPPGSGGAATTSAWSSAGTPKQELPSQPGVIVAGPPGLNLTVGATAQLGAKLLGSDGTVVTPGPSWQWATSDGAVLKVDANGSVAAVAVGMVSVTVTDGVHGTSSLEVAVVDSAPTGPTGIVFDEPLVHVEVGKSHAITWKLVDAAGAPMAASSTPMLVQSGGGKVTLGDGSITGAAQGPQSGRSAEGPG